MQTLHLQKKPKAFSTLHVIKKSGTNPQIHRDFPLCDAQLGSPKLQWCKCYHLGCGKQFSNGTALLQHLQSQDTYMKGNIISHNQKYKNKPQQLTQQCKVCNIKLGNKEELVKHLARLGIQGYWKKGQTYKDSVLEFRSKGLSEKQLFFGKQLKYKDMNYKLIGDLYQTEMCLVCEQFPSNVLYEKCRHFNICYRCYKLLQIKSICIYCKCASDQLFQVFPHQIKQVKI